MHITDKMLLKAHHKALDLRLEKEFISILQKEIQNRNLSIPKKTS